MKVVYKPLKSLKTSDNLTTGKQTGRPFDVMLDQHLKLARNPDIAKLAQNQSQDPNKGLDVLKELDGDYYEKGVKKQTLARTFSSRHSPELQKRISKFKHLIEAKAKKYNLDPNLLAGLIKQESNFNPYALSHCGAMGLGQIMPQTARHLGVKDPFNAAQNLDGAAKYLREQLDTFGDNVNKALAAYNAGPGAVKRYNGIPPYRETQNYVRAITSYRAEIERMNIFTT